MVRGGQGHGQGVTDGVIIVRGRWAGRRFVRSSLAQPCPVKVRLAPPGPALPDTRSQPNQDGCAREMDSKRCPANGLETIK